MTDLGRIASIEASGRAALPALTESALPGWVMRISGGATKRVNSANPVVAGARIEPVRAAVERAYAERDLPAHFRLTPLAAPDSDTALDRAGYRLADPSLTMIASLVATPVEAAVAIADHADPAWCAGLAAASGWSAAQDAAHRAVLARLPAGSAVATLVEDGGALAYGVAGLGEGRACLFDIMVVADARRRGIGRRLVTSLLGWAHAQGHREALLQVLAANAPARALYASLGFVEAYPYQYRIAA